MDIEDVVAKAGAEFMKCKLISNLEFVTPVQTVEPQAVHALWPLAGDPTQALYVRAAPDSLDAGKVHVTARVKQYHRIKEEIRQGVHGPEYTTSDGFLRQSRVAEAQELVDDLLPAFMAYQSARR